MIQPFTKKNQVGLAEQIRRAIKDEMKRKNITPTTLGRVAGVHRQWLARYLRGDEDHQNRGVQWIEKICRTLHDMPKAEARRNSAKSRRKSAQRSTRSRI